MLIYVFVRVVCCNLFDLAYSDRRTTKSFPCVCCILLTNTVLLFNQCMHIDEAWVLLYAFIYIHTVSQNELYWITFEK